MKRLIIFAVLLLAVAAGSYWVMRKRDLRRPVDQWAWMQREFHLSQGQLLHIQALYEAYQPICVEHCNRVLVARRRLTILTHEGHRNTQAYVRALTGWEGVKHECEEATFRHLQEVAAQMNPPDGRRYLAMMVPRVVRDDGEMPVGIR